MRILIILLLIFSCLEIEANQSQQALNKAGQAAYHQLELNKAVKKFQDKYVPKYIIEYSPPLAVILKAAHEKRITYTWDF